MVQKGKFDFDGEEWDEITKEAKDLIKKLICKPEKRLTAQEALEHKWFRKTLKDENSKKINRAIELVINNGGIEYAYGRMIEIKTEAIHLLSDIPDSPAKQSLIGLVEYTVSRDK